MNLKNFYKELKHNRTIALINIFGYSVALSACLIIGLYVYRQLTFDRFHNDVDRIYRLNYISNEKKTHSATTNHQWAEVLTHEIPGIEKAARFAWAFEQQVEFDKHEYTAIGAAGDMELFDIFSFPILEKEADNFLEKPHSVAISKSLATKVFGDESPIGKTITLNYERPCTVTAVFEDIPSNSSLKCDFLTSINDDLEDFGDEMKHHWAWWWLRTFVVVNNPSAVASFSENMKPLQRKYVGDWYVEASTYYLQPYKDIHLHSGSIMGSFDTDVSVNLIYIFCSAGLLILIISCINYINLSTAGFESRKKSVSIKKIIGAGRSFLFKQYMTYSVMLTFLCILIALVIMAYMIPVINKQGINGIDIPYEKPGFWLILLLFGLVTGLLSGWYPARTISKTLMSTRSSQPRSRSLFSNILITFQFFIAITMLIATLTIKKQLLLSIQGNLGYNHTSLISIPATRAVLDHAESVQEEIRKIPGVMATTSCGFQIPGDLGNFYPVQPEGAEKIDIFHTAVSSNFFEVMGIPLKSKLNELREDTARATDRVVINEEAVKRFGIGDAVEGKSFTLGDTRMEITGIVTDFHIGSLRDRIKPTQFTIREKNWNLIARLEKANQAQVISQIGKVWEKFEPVQPFAPHFVDDLIAEQYQKEHALFKLSNVFFALAMLLSLVGLFGLVQLLLRFRVKEIGIRKVNGANVAQIIAMINRDFIRWVVLAFLISCPVAGFVMHKWLQHFAYKTALSWWIFVIAGAAAASVAIFTVSWQSWRTANRNPVEALKYE